MEWISTERLMWDTRILATRLPDPIGRFICHAEHSVARPDHPCDLKLSLSESHQIGSHCSKGTVSITSQSSGTEPREQAPGGAGIVFDDSAQDLAAFFDSSGPGQANSVRPSR